MTKLIRTLRMVLTPIVLCVAALGISACLVDNTPRVLQEATPQTVEAEVIPDADATVPAEAQVGTIVIDEEATDTAAVQPLDAAQVEAQNADQVSTVDISAVLVQASFLINRDVVSLDGNRIGTVNDFVVDSESGQILYVTVSHGGVLGVGASERAIPLSALAWSPDLNLTLTSNEEVLDGLPAIESDWPLASDPQWNDQIGAYWTNLGTTVEDTTGALPMRIRPLFGMIAGEIGGALGPIEDLLFDLGQRQVRYIAVFASPNFYTVDTIAMLPFSLLDLVEVDRQLLPVVFADSALFLMAPNMDRDLFQTVDFIDQPFIGELDARWEELGYPREEGSEE
ncbi:MAG: PRC-barrel domain-containing protein [Caldilineaceae bacterium]|nr:PRC-barrel domain-containing protein [Caldilineaceae bacterium]